MAEIRIGTSGWVYKHWQNRFYPPALSQKKWLSHYSAHFNTVEINSTFYRLQTKHTFEKWFGDVTDDFVYAVKASRYITHVKRLNIDSVPIDRMLDAATGLRNKLGPVLFQLPPNLKYDRGKLRSFLELLPSGYRFVVEPRNDSWFSDDALDILKETGVCLCFTSSPEFPARMERTSDFIFLRMHGSKILYGSNYGDSELSAWAEKIKEWSQQGLDCFVYFNNDANAFAVNNALKLRELVFNRGLISAA